jgi:hypothetical protein
VWKGGVSRVGEGCPSSHPFSPFANRFWKTAGPHPVSGPDLTAHLKLSPLPKA